MNQPPNRTPCNTAVFIFALYEHPEDPVYQGNLSHTIKLVQGLGLEPYVVSPHEQLLADVNLFIKIPESCQPMEMIKPYWRDYNFVFLDHVYFEDTDLKETLEVEEFPKLLASLKLHSFGLAFSQEGCDVLKWIEDINNENLVNVPILVLSNSKRITFSWLPPTTLSSPPPVTSLPSTQPG